MPVDQTGENILFVMGQGVVEAHIQIQYQGDPARFAWVIPIQQKPEISVGSQLLFTNLLNGSVPTFQLTTTFQACNGGPSRSSSGAGCGASSDSGASFSAGPKGGNDKTDSAAPKVISRDSVGNFEVATLEAISVQGLLDWLVQNSFEPDTADAEPVLKDYVDRGYVFVAVKLRPNAGIDEIHPLVIKYAGTEPCVPLKLTRIAAVDDMTVRTFFLGDKRAVPTGVYKHVTLNPVQLDWVTFGQNYNLAVSRAVDSPIANGHAFITEYAGPSAVVDKTGIFNTSWQSSAFTNIDPQSVPTTLETQNLLSCTSSYSCTASHPLVFPLLEKYLPPPAGVTDAQYYSCMSCYPTADLSAWNSSAFAADYDELIATPAKHAVEVLSGNLYLTRMVTRISPVEMTDDPEFIESKGDLEPVSNQLSGTLTTRCDGSIFVTASDGRRVEGSSSTAVSEMPWAETIEEYGDTGDRIVLVDNSQKIDKLLADYNKPRAPKPDYSAATETSGCGVRSPARRASHAIAIGLLGVLGLIRRASRKRKRKG